MTNFSHYQIHYAGFWRRFLAFILDTLMFSLVTTALAIVLYGIGQVMQMKSISVNSIIEWDIVILDQVLPALLTITFWLAWKATPGKLLFDCQIVDADTFQKARFRQLVLRYLCYIISALPLGLGFLWIAFNKRNQGWHDKLSNTVVMLQDESLIKLESYS